MIVRRIDIYIWKVASLSAQPLSDSVDARFRYFDEMREQFCNVDLVFFDPDNGLEVPSKPIGQKTLTSTSTGTS